MSRFVTRKSTYSMKIKQINLLKEKKGSSYLKMKDIPVTSWFLKYLTILHIM